MQDWKLLGTSFISHLFHLSQPLIAATGTFISRTSLPGSLSKSSNSRGLETKARMNPFRMHHQKGSQCPICGFREPQVLHAPDPSASPFPADLLSPRGIQQLLAQRGALTGVSNKTHPERLLGRLKLLLKNIILESQCHQKMM